MSLDVRYQEDRSIHQDSFLSDCKNKQDKWTFTQKLLFSMHGTWHSCGHHSLHCIKCSLDFLLDNSFCNLHKKTVNWWLEGEYLIFNVVFFIVSLVNYYFNRLNNHQTVETKTTGEPYWFNNGLFLGIFCVAVFALWTLCAVWRVTQSRLSTVGSFGARNRIRILRRA